MANSNKTAKFYLFDGHHKIEQFMIVFLAFVIALVSIAGLAYKKTADSRKIFLTEQAVYTTGGVFSLSGSGVTVHNVYRNEDFTRTFVLLQVNDISKLNYNANDYKMLMTHATGDPIEGSPTGGVYVFGNTGYIGLYFTNALGFKSQLYDITLRDDSKLDTYTNKGIYVEGMIDPSDAHHNQMHFRVNFGGTAGVVAKFLDNDSFSIVDAYNETVMAESYLAAKEELSATLLSMNIERMNIDSYEKQLVQYGIRIPNLPVHIAGDYVTNDVLKTESNPSAFNVNMLNASDSIIVDNYNVTEHMKTSEDIEELVASDTLYYVTDFVYPGGLQINYQDMQLEDHSLRDIIGDETYDDFMKKKHIEREGNEYTVAFSPAHYYNTWYYNTGTVFTVSPNDVASKSIQSSIDSYVASVYNLMGLKQRYQCELIYALLSIEASSESIADVTSVNNNTLVVY